MLAASLGLFGILFLNALFQPFLCGYGVNSSQLCGLRLAHAFSLLYGFGYPSANSGPLLQPIYGPLGFVVYWPAAVFSLPSDAILAGQIIAAACFFLPALWLFAGKDRAYALPDSLLAFAAFGMWACSKASLKQCAFIVHADAPVLALLAGAAWLLTGKETRARRVLSALFVALAVWSKQTALPAGFALAAYLWLAGGFKKAFLYAALCAVSLFAVTVPVVLWLGAGDLWLNMISVPSQHPWISPDKWRASIAVTGTLLRSSALPLALLAFGLWRESRAGAFQNGLRAWVRTRRESALVLAGLGLVPAAFLGTVKLGGVANNLGLPAYFWMIAALLSVLRNGKTGRIVLYALIALAAMRSAPVLIQNPAARNESRFVQDRAMRFAKERPGEVYLPGMPLSAFLAEKRLDHSFTGMADRVLAAPVSDAHFRKHLPPRMKWIVFGPPSWFAPLDLRILDKFPGWTSAEVPGLRGWTGYAATPTREV